MAVFSWSGRKDQDQMEKEAGPFFQAEECLFSLFRSRARKTGKTSIEIRRIARFPGPK
jgi:hypothetical protein